MRKEGFLIMALAAGLFFFAPDAFADWSAVERLTWNPGISARPDIAIDSGNAVHVVWADDTPGNLEIYYKNYDKGWSHVKRLTWSAGASYYPAIAVDSNDTVYVVWQDDTPGEAEIYCLKSANQGKTWSLPRRLTWTSKHSGFPAIRTDPANGIHLVWEDLTPGNNEIYYKNSLAGGESWSPAKRLTWTSSDFIRPAMEIRPSDTIIVVWEEWITGVPEIFTRRSPDKGVTWRAAWNFTESGGVSTSPAIATGLGSTHFVWQESKAGGSGEIFHRRSTDGGATWGAARRLTWTNYLSSRPAMAIEGDDTIHLAWENRTAGYPRIYYKRSTNGGATWIAGERVSWSIRDCLDPALAADSNMNIHVVWFDEYTPDNWEIFYSRGNY